MARQAITNNGSNSRDKGNPLSPEQLQQLFIGEIAIGGYQYTQGENSITSGSTNLVTRTIFGTIKGATGLSGINRFMNVARKDATGNVITERTQSVYNADQVKRIKLPESIYGLAIARKDSYTTKDSAGRAADADATFSDYTAFADIMAHSAKEIRIIKNLVVNKAVELGIIGQNYEAIDFENADIKAYWTTEVAPRFQALAKTHSLWALTQPGGIFEGYTVFEKDNGQYGKTYDLARR